MGSTCIDQILHNLELLERILERENNETAMLKLDLRFLRTFIICSIKYRREIFSQAGQDMPVAVGSSLFRIEDAVHVIKQTSEDAVCKMKQISGGADLRTEQSSEDGFKSSDLNILVSDFRKIISSFNEETKEAYRYMCESSLKCVSLRSDELVEITESLLENLSDLKWSKPYDQAFFMVRDYDKILGELVEVLDAKLMFFRSFIRYVTWLGVEHGRMEDLLTHFQVMVVDAARATYMSWFDRFDKLILIFVELGEISPTDPSVKEDNKWTPQLLDKIKLDGLKFQEMYIQVLTAPKSSDSSQRLPLDVLVDFVDSLGAHLFELLNYNDCSVTVNDKMQIVYEGLRFLTNFLKNQQKRYMEQAGHVKDLIELVVNDAGIVICSLFVNRMKEIPDEGMDLALLSLLEKIKLVKAKIDPNTTDGPEIDRRKYHTDVEKAVQISSNVLPQRSDPIITEPFVGLLDEIQEIIDQLTRGSEQLKTVTIAGMPGLGKTTLAKRLYNDSTIVNHFHIHGWCCISQVYSKKGLLSEILSYIVPEFPNQSSEKDEDDLALQLYKGLKGRRYLIVLDDVWNIEAWNALVGSFPDDSNGSRILLTSRMTLQIRPNDQVHSLRQLSDDESWELLQKKLFPKQAYPDQLRDIAMQIAQNCNGLPLSVIIIAGILGNIEHNSWEKIAKSLRSDAVIGTENVKNILEMSYTHLSDCLKKCFLYFGAFPEDREIPIWKLKCLWIAEEFVQNDDSGNLQDLAERYLMDLVGRSLVMVGKTSSTKGVKYCRIHDLLHEFCIMKAEEESFIRVLHGSGDLFNLNELGSTCRLCIYSQVKDFQLSRIFCPRIPSLLIFPLGDVPQVCNISFVFRVCKLLRVLDLEQIVIGNTFPSEIELLVELRYLAIHGDIRSIPLSVANLLNLETFYLKVFYVEALMPVTIWNLRKLRHLSGLCKWDDSNLAEYNLEASESLDYLDTLQTLTLSNGPAVNKVLRKLPNIRKLKCRILDAGNSSEDHERIVEMGFLQQLESLKLFLGPTVVKFLFPDNLKKLSLEGFSWSIVSTVGKLPNLEVLKLHKAYGEVNWEMEEGEFGKLKTLKLGYLAMIGWTGSEYDLPCLNKLVLKKMWKLHELPYCLNDSSTLERIEVQWCQPSVESLARDIEETQRNGGNEDFKMIVMGWN